MSGAVALHRAYCQGDLAAIRAAHAGAPDFPNTRGMAGLDEIPLQYAIYHAPLGTVRALLDQGADPNFADPGGFPALLAALSTRRADLGALLALLLGAGADPNRRGVNDWTALHWAANAGDTDALRALLAAGADAGLRTRVDDFETALELAQAAGHAAAVAILADATPRGG